MFFQVLHLQSIYTYLFKNENCTQHKNCKSRIFRKFCFLESLWMGSVKKLSKSTTSGIKIQQKLKGLVYIYVLMFILDFMKNFNLRINFDDKPCIFWIICFRARPLIKLRNNGRFLLLKFHLSPPEHFKWIAPKNLKLLRFTNGGIKPKQ